jgi:ATP-dependent Clp protease ATP-binding subunit ClpC
MLADTDTHIVRRYREEPSPLVRDSGKGWRTGRFDLVVNGDFDLFSDAG